MFLGASNGPEPSLFFSSYLFGIRFKPFQDDFHHDFVRVTDSGVRSGL